MKLLKPTIRLTSMLNRIVCGFQPKT